MKHPIDEVVVMFEDARTWLKLKRTTGRPYGFTNHGIYELAFFRSDVTIMDEPIANCAEYFLEKDFHYAFKALQERATSGSPEMRTHNFRHLDQLLLREEYEPDRNHNWVKGFIKRLAR